MQLKEGVKGKTSAGNGSIQQQVLFSKYIQQQSLVQQSTFVISTDQLSNANVNGTKLP